SPKKSWEGFAGSMVAGAVGAVLVLMPRVGKACETFDKAPGLVCRAGRWRADTTPEVGEPCRPSMSDRGRGLECRGGTWRRE
ncbi:hypothetical protein P1N98_02110, partial [Tsukamurella tyrosinosolvens]|uniref:hypothetical protein n=1 Tax=Tsukamurella tyrosinosolvens TaxID=57704 RepID=UPI0024811E49